MYGKTSLKAHLQRHTRRAAFVCNWLFTDKRFTRSDELLAAPADSTGEKRFACR